MEENAAQDSVAPAVEPTKPLPVEIKDAMGHTEQSVPVVSSEESNHVPLASSKADDSSQQLHKSQEEPRKEDIETIIEQSTPHITATTENSPSPDTLIEVSDRINEAEIKTGLEEGEQLGQDQAEEERETEEEEQEEEHEDEENYGEDDEREKEKEDDDGVDPVTKELEYQNLFRRRLGLPPLTREDVIRVMGIQQAEREQEEERIRRLQEEEDEEDEEGGGGSRADGVGACCDGCGKCDGYIPNNFTPTKDCKSCGCALIHHLVDEEDRDWEDDQYVTKYGGYEDDGF